MTSSGKSLRPLHVHTGLFLKHTFPIFTTTVGFFHKHNECLRNWLEFPWISLSFGDFYVISTHVKWCQPIRLSSLFPLSYTRKILCLIHATYYNEICPPSYSGVRLRIIKTPLYLRNTTTFTVQTWKGWNNFANRLKLQEWIRYFPDIFQSPHCNSRGWLIGT